MTWLFGIIGALRERVTRPSPEIHERLQDIEDLTERILDAERRAERALHAKQPPE